MLGCKDEQFEPLIQMCRICIHMIDARDRDGHYYLVVELGSQLREKRHGEFPSHRCNAEIIGIHEMKTKVKSIANKIFTRA